MAVTFRHAAFTPVFTTMTIRVNGGNGASDSRTYDIASVYNYMVQQGGGGLAADGVCTAYSYYGYEGLTIDNAVKATYTLKNSRIPKENPQAVASRTMTDFKPKHGKRRYWGSGYLGQTKDGRWNGRYTVAWPDGTKRTQDVYADTEEEREKLLATMITEMKTEVAAEKERLKTENRVG